MKTIFLVIIALTVSAPSFSDEIDRPLSEEKLLTYATTSFYQVNEDFIYLGQLNGTPVVAEFICSDLCPHYTVRVIRYELNDNLSCGEVGGMEKELIIPVSIAARNEVFCFPKVLVNNWWEYQRKLSYLPAGVGPHE